MYGKRLRISRKKANLTLKQVGDILHTTHSTISKYENKQLRIVPDTLAAFCKLYNVSADYILGLPKDMPYPDDKENSKD